MKSFTSQFVLLLCFWVSFVLADPDTTFDDANGLSKGSSKRIYVRPASPASEVTDTTFFKLQSDLDSDNAPVLRGRAPSDYDHIGFIPPSANVQPNAMPTKTTSPSMEPEEAIDNEAAPPSPATRVIIPPSGVEPDGEEAWANPFEEYRIKARAASEEMERRQVCPTQPLPSGRCTCSNQTHCRRNAAHPNFSPGCFNLRNNQDHCGDCYSKCGSSQNCVRGGCVCQRANLSACGKSCVNMQNNEAHCGSCGHVCRRGQTCRRGRCIRL